MTEVPEIPDPADTTVPLDGDRKDEASRFLESLGLSKVAQASSHRVAATLPDGPALVGPVPRVPASPGSSNARAARQPTAPGLYRRLRDEAGTADPRAEVLETVRERIHRRVITELGPVFYNTVVDPKEVRSRVEGIVQTALRGEKTPMSVRETAQVAQVVTDEVLGHGPIERLVRDPTVSEIMVNGPDQVYVERNGRIERTRISFVSDGHLRHVITRIVGEVGRHIDESSPMVDARLPDGSRVNAVFPPLCVGGPFLTIRKFAADPLMMEDLIDFGTLTPPVAELLQACVQGKANIMVSGGAGTGKTTMLNVLSSFIPADERIITIEDAKELQLRQDHVLCLEYRPANTEGAGEITIRDLLRNSLRMRPDRIIIGECRSGEALDMLQAMNTGHEGSLTTVHANSPRDALSRVETMTLMAGFDLPMRAVREQMAAALDLIVHLSRMRDGSRRVTHVTEVGRMEGEMILLQDVFTFDYRMGVDEHGRALGHLKATGLRPHITQRLADRGIKLDPTIFDTDVFAKASVPQIVPSQR
ncbi:MAG TPA: CpaF family protein [Acidimicrobiales bacterium]|nr:CpaF family protein [Acidimicrobiales bacterium]